MAKNAALSAYRAGERSRGARRGRRRKQFTIPLAVVAGMVPMLAEGKRYMDIEGSIWGFPKGLTASLTGWSPITHDWIWWRMKYGLFPLLGGFAIHKAANMFGINRMLKSAGIPLLRI